MQIFLIFRFALHLTFSFSCTIILLDVYASNLQVVQRSYRYGQKLLQQMQLQQMQQQLILQLLQKQQAQRNQVFLHMHLLN